MINSGVDLLAKTVVKILGKANNIQKMPTLMADDQDITDADGPEIWSVEAQFVSEKAEEGASGRLVDVMINLLFSVVSWRA
jgi:hypothetical protein